jgi:hypothetical protein
MGMLQQFEPAGQGTVLDSHRVIEALRVGDSIASGDRSADVQLAYGQRNELGDPAFTPGVVEKQKEWISAEATKERARMIKDDQTFPPDYYALDQWVGSPLRVIGRRLTVQGQHQVRQWHVQHHCGRLVWPGRLDYHHGRTQLGQQDHGARLRLCLE